MLKKQIILISLLLLAFASCNKDSDEPSIHDIHKRLYDKTWYSIDQNYQVNHYFSSDGTFIISPNQGTWEWRPNDTLNLYNINNNNETIRIWITRLEDNYFEYWPVWEPENVRYKFSTTKP